MSTLYYQRNLPYERSAVFDVVADIERYPEFVPGCRQARVIRREGSRWWVEQEMGLHRWHWRFRTVAHVEKPERIRIETDEKPFRYLRQLWRFEAVSNETTRLTLEADYRLSNRFVERLFAGFFDEALARTVTAFERRTLQLCS